MPILLSWEQIFKSVDDAEELLEELEELASKSFAERRDIDDDELEERIDTILAALVGAEVTLETRLEELVTRPTTMARYHSNLKYVRGVIARLEKEQAKLIDAPTGKIWSCQE